MAEARGRRDNVVIATKVGMWEKRKGLKREKIIEGCEDSLRRLGVETIDLYWLHRDDEETPPDEYVGALDTLAKPAKCAPSARRTSAWRDSKPRSSESKRARACAFDAQQPEYSLMNREIEKDLMPLCAREGVAILPYYPLASGYLTGKYRTRRTRPRACAAAERQISGRQGQPVLAALDASPHGTARPARKSRSLGSWRSPRSRRRSRARLPSRSSRS